MIHLIDNYYADADSDQYILIKTVMGKSKKDGSPVEYHRAEAFFSTMNGLLAHLQNVLVRNDVQSEKITTIEEWINASRDYANQIDKLITEATKHD